MRRIFVGVMAALVCAATASCQAERTLYGTTATPPHISSNDVEPITSHEPPHKDPPFEPGRKVSEAERWFLSDARARRDLEGTPFGEQEIREFWLRKGWQMTKREEQYQADVKRLLQEGRIEYVSRWAVCPYTPVYRALAQITVMGTNVHRLQEFHFEMCENENELQLGTPRFTRVKTYQEDHEDGHGTEHRKPGPAPSSHKHDH